MLNTDRTNSRHIILCFKRQGFRQDFRTKPHLLCGFNDCFCLTGTAGGFQPDFRLVVIIKERSIFSVFLTRLLRTKIIKTRRQGRVNLHIG